MPRYSASSLAAAPWLALSLTLSAALPTAATAEPLSDFAGAYLAARHADAEKDFPAASLWYHRALLVDPANPSLLQGALNADLVLGQTEEAARIAQILLKSGDKNQLAAMAVLTSDILANRYANILSDQKAGHTVGTLVDRLIAAWAKVGMGDMTAAQADFDSLIKNSNTESFGIYHKALALASSGDFEGADRLLSSPAAATTMKLRRAVLAQVQILSQLERNPDAITLIDTRFGTRLDDATADLRARLVKGETLPFDIARNARDGLAEVFFTIATALADQAGPTFTLLYARTATVLRPDHAEAQVMTARVLEDIDQLDLAIQAFTAVPETDAAYVTAQIGAAEATIRLGRVDEAVRNLQELAAKRPEDINIKTALGDAQRRAGDCALAVKSYDAAIAMVPDPAPGNWPLFYKRAGCLAQIGNWPAAEADFRFALKLDPAQPRVLNELGYSYVDRGENLDEALQMIQRAVSASPDSGYIVDSLAWAYFRMGRFQDAMAPQEKASKLMPLDPVVTDHLGDIYWAVGRKREAEFQWRRALSFGPEDSETARIQRKLDIGLDQVLIEEKANPPKPAPALPAPNGN